MNGFPAGRQGMELQPVARRQFVPAGLSLRCRLPVTHCLQHFGESIVFVTVHQTLYCVFVVTEFVRPQKHDSLILTAPNFSSEFLMPCRFVCALLLTGPAAWCASGLTYSTFLQNGFTPSAIATDQSGNVYLAGSNPANPNYPGTWPSAAIVVKLDPTGATYLYSRTIGGSAHDTASGIAVDSSGNAYIAGTTSSPDFPVTPGLQNGTLPTSAGDTRAFMVKLSSQGEIVFSEVLGTVTTTAAAVALAADGGILVSGTGSAQLAASGGAYNVPNSSQTFLMKVSASGANIVFTAVGIGGSALAVDSAGNIYMAGSSVAGLPGGTDYPTTAGAYQTVLPFTSICSFPCTFGYPGTDQYLTKVDPTASKLIYSTGVTGTGQTVNNGLAVDAAGNAYVTGLAYGGYNWTVAPTSTAQVKPFLTKIDPAGANALYSIPIGGAGVALGSQSDVFVGGVYNEVNLETLTGAPPPAPIGVAGLPAQCATNNITTFSEGTISHLDASTGNLLDTVLVDGSNVSTSGIAFAGNSSVWLAGSTTVADVPITSGAPTPLFLTRGAVSGAYLGEANFNLAANNEPQISCILDSANMARASVVAPNQLITLLGTGLGPSQGVAATDYQTTTLAGVTVTLGGVSAPLLYVSSSQINVAVPSGVLEQSGEGEVQYSTMQLSVNNVTAPPRVLPLTTSNPSLFGDLSGTVYSCTVGPITTYGAFPDLALNASGSLNSCQNPASAGQQFSLYVNGLGVDLLTSGTWQPWQASQIPVAVALNGTSAEVIGVSSLNPFVWQVTVLVPPEFSRTSLSVINVTMDLNLADGVIAAGPLAIQPVSSSYTAPGTPFPLGVWVGQ
jgi:uncharacterized protein (TIGR03437 family)